MEFLRIFLGVLRFKVNRYTQVSLIKVCKLAFGMIDQSWRRVKL